jgi:hypothetical protein
MLELSILACQNDIDVSGNAYKQPWDYCGETPPILISRLPFMLSAH